MDTPIFEKINKFCEKNNLSEKVKKQILKFSSDSYIIGSNDADKLIKKYYHLIPKK